MNKEAAEKNFCILMKSGKCLGKSLKAQDGSHFGYGSEFRPVELLAKVFKFHPNWSRMKSFLTNGSAWHKEMLNEPDQ
eukprot:5808094-Ditylum_brightwellii.AAC.1